MKKFALFAIVLGVAGWWHWIGGRSLSEAQARAFYQDYETATLSRQPEALCRLLDERFTATGSVSFMGKIASQTQDKAQTCRGWVDMYRAWDELGEKMGGILHLNHQYTIHGITISPDGQTATVDVSVALDVGGSLMNIRARSTDTLIRRNGMVRLLRSHGSGSIGSGS